MQNAKLWSRLLLRDPPSHKATEDRASKYESRAFFVILDAGYLILKGNGKILNPKL